jgi:hypothetical protein
VSLEDIEVVNLERVGFNLKNFDMAIVFKVGIPTSEHPRGQGRGKGAGPGAAPAPGVPAGFCSSRP